MGVMRLRRIIRRAKSTFSDALYFTANTAASWRSMDRKMPVRRLMPPGSRTSIFRMKEAVPSSTDLPMDGGGVAPLLVEAEVVHLLVMAALAAQQAVKQPLEAAVRGPGQGGGVGATLASSSPNTFTPLRLDGPRGEQVRCPSGSWPAGG